MDLQPVVSTVAPAIPSAPNDTASLEQLMGSLQTFFSGQAGSLTVTAVIILVVALMLRILFAVLFGRIAAQKGYSGGGWGVFTFFFPMIGVIAIAIKPDLEARRREEEYHKNMVRELHRLNQTMYGMMTGAYDPNQQP